MSPERDEGLVDRFIQDVLILTSVWSVVWIHFQTPHHVREMATTQVLRTRSTQPDSRSTPTRHARRGGRGRRRPDRERDTRGIPTAAPRSSLPSTRGGRDRELDTLSILDRAGHPSCHVAS